jgi:hypothetical protein
MTKEIDYYIEGSCIVIEADHGFIEGWEGLISEDGGTVFVHDSGV